MKNVAWAAIAVLFLAMTAMNLMSAKRSAQVEHALETCVREYRLLLEESPCPAR